MSRAIRLLGGESRALVAMGGHNGDKLRALLEAEGIRLIPLVAPGETRLSIAVTDSSTGEQFRFVLPGPIWSEAGSRAILAAVTTAVPEEGYVVISGSIPKGLSDDFLDLACSKIGRSGARIVCDTSGPALDRVAAGGCETPPYILRMDQKEAEALSGRKLPGRGDSVDFAAELVARGVAQVVVVARGADGSVLAADGVRLHAEAAKVPVRSKVGAGDSFVGGFTLALARDEGLERALQWGTAAASAAVMTDATALCTREDTEALFDRCPVSVVP
ncbi:Tagatose-6-phosphate kinase [Rhodovulum sp. P5]|uniref:1-phosphofructokinase family hexose kinase n=1 Tax=Rhodovulum sp. P5 TaxID=1564506 RepID=UPI0009C21AE8|nr:Tagatose-6-phosphate kinase [Rhodovulum sp. P5]